MAAPEWALTPVESALLEGSDHGGTYTLDALQEKVGIGHDDLVATLDALREQGKATEESPGEWTASYAEEASQTRAALAHEDGEEGEHDREHATSIRPGDPAPANGVVETVLTAGMASKLEANTIGALVMAGLADAKGRPFVLRIEP